MNAVFSSSKIRHSTTTSSEGVLNYYITVFSPTLLYEEHLKVLTTFAINVIGTRITAPETFTYFSHFVI
jgi:hypothetical protein